MRQSLYITQCRAVVLTRWPEDGGPTRCLLAVGHDGPHQTELPMQPMVDPGPLFAWVEPDYSGYWATAWTMLAGIGVGIAIFLIARALWP